MSATSIHSTNGQGLVAIYPNPANNEVTLVHSDRRLRGTKASLTDQQGRTVMCFPITHEKQAIDIADLSPGLYYLRMENGVSMKLMKY